MAKIHTHYDNLKVARLAPQEVIRAAYKALSQKYHPDKNPGDEKAARIMAILNSAYTTLSDPVRRKEHDEWIAAEEWEIEWLESTRSEDKPRAEPSEPVRRYHAGRDVRWWLALALSLALGCAGGILLMGQPKLLPAALAGALAARGEVPAAAVPAARAELPLDSWAVAKAYEPEAGAHQAPDVKALAVIQLVVPARVPDCETELHALVAPNGEPWPNQSGYVEGYPLGNEGEETRLQVDNTGNDSPVFVKIYDLERRSNVRHLYVLAHDAMAVEKLGAGKYEVRYQNVEVGGSKADCLARKRRGMKQVAAGTPEA
ncbi:MAG: J domain-containing protein [Pseudomonadota bacterium]